MRPTRTFLPLLIVATLGAVTQAHATECFSMFDAQNRLVYQSSTTPIDLSRPVSSEMAAHFPSRSLVISDVGTCIPVDTYAASPNAAAALLSMRNSDAREDRYPLASDTVATTGAGTRAR